MTENILTSMLHPALASVDGPAEEQLRLSSAGQQYPGTELRIVDDLGMDVPRGEIGEILVRSASMMSGYWRNPSLTSEVLKGAGCTAAIWGGRRGRVSFRRGS